MRRGWRAFLLSILLVGCGERAAPAPPAAPEPPPVEPSGDDVDGEEEPEEVEEAPLDLDRMERPELEAACFQGSQAACDRLGH